MNNDKIVCPRCGDSFKSTARYCMKCGYLNYDHPENVGLKEYQTNLNDATVYVNAATSLKDYKVHKKNFDLVLGDNIGNKTICFIVNITLYFLFLVMLSSYKNDFTNISGIISTRLLLNYISVTVAFLYVYSMELIFMKMNEKWWYLLIPYYNSFVLAKKVLGSGWLSLLTFVPGVSLIYGLVLTYVLGVKFGYNGFLFVILSFIYIPICAFGTSSFCGITYVSEEGDDTLEKEKRLNKIFLFLIVFVFISSLSLLIFI